jgi:hypothetical protein
LDSLGFERGEEEQQIFNMKNWLAAAFSGVKWNFNVPFSSTPHQKRKDGSNCGAFICLYATLAAQNKSIQAIDEFCRTLDIDEYRTSLLLEVERNLQKSPAVFCPPVLDSVKSSILKVDDEEIEMEHFLVSSLNEQQIQFGDKEITVDNFLDFLDAPPSMTSSFESQSPTTLVL